MSMSQTDKLKEKAHSLRMLSEGLSAPYVLPKTKEIMYLEMNQAADYMEEAAETISELRESLTVDYWVTKAHNDIFRELTKELYEVVKQGKTLSLDEFEEIEALINELGIEVDA